MSKQQWSPLTRANNMGFIAEQDEGWFWLADADNPQYVLGIFRSQREVDVAIGVYLATIHRIREAQGIEASQAVSDIPE